MTLTDADEAVRLAALENYDILDTEPEELFDDLTVLASQACGTPISLISLVAKERQWFKSRVGLDVTETPREVSFCAQLLDDSESTLLVENALKDERFATNPLVLGTPYIRFYAGVALVNPAGHRLGTLCVIDHQPRSITSEQLETLKILARQVMHGIETRRCAQLLLDSTSQLHAQNRHLAKLEKRTKAIIRSISDAVVVADEAGHLELFNPAAEKIFGLGLTDTDKESWSATYGIYLEDGETLCPTEQLPLVRALQGRTVDEMHLIIDNPNTTKPCVISARSAPIVDDDGIVQGGVAVMQDITERKAVDAELYEYRQDLERRVRARTAELEASEQKYQNLYDDAPDMYISVDADTSTIVECNRTLSLTTGFARDELIGRSVFEIYDPDCLDDAHKALHASPSNGDVHRVELALKRRSNSSLDVCVHISVTRDDNGEVVLRRLVLRDITEQKLLEEQARIHRDVNTHFMRVATMGEMASGMAHELNQPLYAIHNFARGAARRLVQGGMETADMTAVFDDIAKQAERAGDIVHGLRRYVTPREEALESLPVEDILDAVATILRPELRRRQVDLQVDHRAPHSLVACDGVQIEQVLLNLILNACDAYDGLATDHQLVELNVTCTAQRDVEFSVRDHGPGIERDAVDKIFDPYFSTKKDGLGMGLAISRTIAERHGGTLTARCNDDGGATFALTLPLATADDE